MNVLPNKVSDRSKFRKEIFGFDNHTILAVTAYLLLCLMDEQGQVIL